VEEALIDIVEAALVVWAPSMFKYAFGDALL